MQVLERLASECSASGYRLAFDLFGSAEDAEDAVQDALAIACRRISELRDPQAMVAWFHRILTRHCLGRLRRRRIGRALAILWPGQVVAEAEELVDLAPRADRSLAEAQRLRRLLAAVHALPPRQKAAVVLRYGYDQSISEIAETLGVGAGSVRTHLQRALATLRDRQGDTA